MERRRGAEDARMPGERRLRPTDRLATEVGNCAAGTFEEEAPRGVVPDFFPRAARRAEVGVGLAARDHGVLGLRVGGGTGRTT